MSQLTKIYTTPNLLRIGVVVSVFALILAIFLSVAAHAALSSTSLGLGESRPSGGGVGTNVQYTLTSNGFNTGQTIGCIEVDLGTAADAVTNVPGASTASSTFVSQTITATGTWAVSNTSSSEQKLRMTNATPVAPQSGSQTAVWGGITNGTTADTPYYAKITTYTTNACSTPVDTTTVQFVYTNGTAVTASVDPSLSFAVAGTSSGTTCNGASSNVTTTATTVPFGTVTTSTNKVGVQNLTVSTNAANGYTVAARYTGVLASGSNDIDNHGGTNAAPTAFSAAGADEAYGYTTNDSTLGTGTANRFTSTPNVWAAFATSNAEVAYNNAPASSQVTCVGQQVGIDGATPAGSFSTTVIYTATPVY